MPDLPTPDQIHAYLLATGWIDTDTSASSVRYVRGWHVLTVPRNHPLRLRSALQTLGYLERRPSPEEQVARAIVEHAEASDG